MTTTAITPIYTWKIDGLRTSEEPQSKYVVEVSWTITGAYNFYQVGIGSRTVLDDTVDTAPFIDYEDLVESEVIQWLKTTLGSEAIAALESQISERITANQQPVTRVLTDRIPPWVVVVVVATTSTSTTIIVD